MIFWSWVIVMVSIPGAGGRGAVPARGENRAPPPGTNDGDLPFPKLVRSAILASKRAGIWPMGGGGYAALGSPRDCAGPVRGCFGAGRRREDQYRRFRRQRGVRLGTG